MNKIFYILILSLAFVACKKKATNSPNRSFYQAVTPWPPDFTIKGKDLAYAFIKDNCDMVSHHFDDGVPWEEAYAGLPFPKKYADDLKERRERTPSDKKILLSVAPLDISRKKRAGYYAPTDAATNKDFVSKWENKTLDDTTIIKAYINYISYLITELNPDFINYGVESNSKDWDKTEFEKYKTFLSGVYTGLKTKYPNKPFFISFMVTDEEPFLTNARALEPYTDWITISAYPYSYIGSPVNGDANPALIPSGLFPSFRNINPTKPFAVAETGFIAQDLNLTLVKKKGTPQWQEDYMNYLLKFCNDNDAKFVVWFCAYDYDDMINTFNALGINQELFYLWRDTGLYDEKLVMRPACKVWTDWLNLPVR